MPSKYVKEVAGIELAENGKVRCVRFNKDLTKVFEGVKKNMISNTKGLSA